ncbi:MAG: ATP-binding cassette domain-containing protein [Propionibacteriaceae bacterium]
MSETNPATAAAEPVVSVKASGLVKRYGHVTAIGGADFELYQGEVLAVIGDNGAGKSSMIKALTGALVPDEGEIFLEGERVDFRNPLDARKMGIETVYQDLAVSPSLGIDSNVYLGRELRKPGFLGKVFRQLDKKTMREESSRLIREMGVGLQSADVTVDKLSGGQRQSVAVVRAAAFASRVVFLDEPTAALGVKESGMVVDMIRRVRDRGLPVVLISHDMPLVFDIADRIHIHRLGRRIAVVDPKRRTPSEVVAIMTGAIGPDELDEDEVNATITPFGAQE